MRDLIYKAHNKLQFEWQISTVRDIMQLDAIIVRDKDILRPVVLPRSSQKPQNVSNALAITNPRSAPRLRRNASTVRCKKPESNHSANGQC